MSTSTRECPSCRTQLPAEAQFCFRCGHATPTEPGVPPRTAHTGEIEVTRVREVLADRYRIERVIGEGGMATVYLAEDLKHHRQVAVKVMRPELAATLGGDRFLREVEIAAQLNHPHILPMHDSGEADGVLYYVMPYVEGESLGARIAREGELPLTDALRIAREVAEALAYAHKRGIVHRDIKPANILLNEGHALVADFGIARAVHSDGTAITATGLAIGTPQYMSPEQATGGREVDGRTDIYALGVVLYEMLAGEPPFTGRTPQAVVARMMTERPRPLASTREGLPGEVDDSVTRALARSPADRYPTAAEFVAALADAELAARTPSRPPAGTIRPPASRPAHGIVNWRNTAIAAVAALLVWAGVAFFGGRGAAAADGVPEGTHVAVLPFQNQGDSADNYIVDGITDEVRGRLARVGGLAIIGSGSSGGYRGSSMPQTQIARELGADYLLVGRVRWAGDGDARRLQVVSELVNGGTGATQWQQSFEAPLTDVFAVQGQIAARVAGALGAQLGAAETQNLARRPTANPAAWDAYLKGVAITSLDAGALRVATAHLENAVALDSTLIEAWIALSRSTGRLYANGGRDLRMASRSREALDRALALDSTSAVAHAAAAGYYAIVEIDGPESRRSLDRALALAPNSPEVLALAGRLDILLGDYARGVQLVQRARELDPRNPAILQDLQWGYMGMGRFADAIEVGEAASVLAPLDAGIHQELAMAHLASGDPASAANAAQRLVTNGMSPPVVAAYFGGFYEMSWMLPPDIRGVIGRLGPSAFDDDVAWWGQTLATHYWTAGDRRRAQVYADSALEPSRIQAEDDTSSAGPIALYGVMLAYLGRRDEAIAAARGGVERELRVGDDGARNTQYQRIQLVRVYLALGENDAALDQIEKVLVRPAYMNRAWMRLDPLFEPLRGNPRFERMVAGV